PSQWATEWPYQAGPRFSRFSPDGNSRPSSHNSRNVRSHWKSWRTRSFNMIISMGSFSSQTRRGNPWGLHLYMGSLESVGSLTSSSGCRPTIAFFPASVSGGRSFGLTVLRSQNPLKSCGSNLAWANAEDETRIASSNATTVHKRFRIFKSPCRLLVDRTAERKHFLTGRVINFSD